MQRKAYLEDTGYGISKCRSRIYRYIYHYEIQALGQLVNAKDKNRMLFLLGFIDASRLGSTKTAELHEHLASVLSAWDSEQAASIDLSKKTDKNHSETLFAREVYLIREGEDRRRMCEEQRAEPGFWNPGPGFGNAAEESWFKGDNLDFVEFGPSVGRLRTLVECAADDRSWGDVCPGVEHAALWYSFWMMILYCGHRAVIVYLMFYGYYDITLPQFLDWLDGA